MTLVRRFARPLLASTFIYGGAEALRNPTPKAPDASGVAPPIAKKIPYLPEDPEQLVKINAGVQVGAGSLLAIGRFPRLSALALAGSTALTTAAGHRYWEETDPGKKGEQQQQFIKNVGLLGGLLIAAVDTQGKPSLAWYARRAGKTTKLVTKAGRTNAALTAKTAKQQARTAKQSAKLTAKAGSALTAARAARGAAKGQTKVAGKAAKLTGKTAKLTAYASSPKTTLALKSPKAAKFAVAAKAARRIAS